MPPVDIIIHFSFYFSCACFGLLLSSKAPSDGCLDTVHRPFVVALLDKSKEKYEKLIQQVAFKKLVKFSKF